MNENKNVGQTVGRFDQFIKIIKKTLFQSLFVLQRNSFNQKYLNLTIETLQIFACLFFYINPVFSHLNNFAQFKSYFQGIYKVIAIFQPSQELLLSWIILLVLPSFAFLMILMKLFIGYNYLLVLAIQVFLLFVPVFFIKFCLQLLNVLVNSGSLIPFGVLLVITNLVLAALTLHLYNKKRKFLEFFLTILFFFKINQYVLITFLGLKIGAQYWLYRNQKMKNVKFGFQLSLFIIVVSCYLATDYFTNYLAFVLLLSGFTISPIAIVHIQLEQDEQIFFYLQNLTENKNKIKFYEYCEKHIRQCELINCQCRQILKIKQIQKLKEWGFSFIKSIFKNRQSLDGILEFAQICCNKYQYSLVGLSNTLSIKATNIMQQYRVYYVVTCYQQEYRKTDRNYAFGQQYFNVHQQIQKFQSLIEDLTYIIHKFWLTVMQFDGSKKFINLIFEISQKINQIKKNYEFYNDRYQDYIEFKYFYKTFELAILNMQPQREDIYLKIPEKQLFFVSREELIANCNIEFCNLVQCQKSSLIGKKYVTFIPDVYADHHDLWVKEFIQEYHPDKVFENLKTIKIKNDYIKLANITNWIIPRFSDGVQILTIIKIQNCLQNKTKISQQNQDDTFFSFLIQKESFKIICMDEAFFQIAHLEETQQLKNRIIGLKINDLFPKIYIAQNNLSLQTVNREVMINYSSIQELFGARQKYYSLNMSKNLQQEKIINNISIGNGNNKKKLQKKKSSTDGQSIFYYEILQQKNSGLQIQYCIANFKLKGDIFYNANEKKEIEDLDSIQNTDFALKEISQSQKEKPNQFNYSLPFPLTLSLVGIHFVFIYITNMHLSLMHYCQNALQFFLLYDYTSLLYMNVRIGQNKLSQLKKLWIAGYGFFSESFLNFQKADDSFYNSLLYSQNIKINHNSIFNQINEQIKSQINNIQLWRYAILFCLIGLMIFFVIDLWTSVRYCIRVYQNVKNIILIFLNIANQDIKSMISANQVFQLQVLELKHYSNQIKQQPYFNEKQQNSISYLMKKSSILNTLGENQEDLTINQINNKRRSRNSSHRSNGSRSSSKSLKNQINKIKQQLKIQNNSFIENQALTNDNSSQKNILIQKFKKKYGEKWTIFQQNSSLFITLLINFCVVILVLIAFIIVLPLFISNYQKEINTYYNLRLMPVVIFKSIMIKLTNFTLLPQVQMNSFSNSISLLVDQTSQMPLFTNFWTNITNNNVCPFVSLHLLNMCNAQSSVTIFGQKVIYEQLQQYIRQASSINFLTNSQDFMNIAQVQLNLLQISNRKFEQQITNYLSYTKNMQKIMVIIGSILLVISVFVSYKVLQKFKEKIKNTESLLMIVPKTIKDKNWNQNKILNQLTQENQKLHKNNERVSQSQFKPK